MQTLSSSGRGVGLLVALLTLQLSQAASVVAQEAAAPKAATNESAQNGKLYELRFYTTHPGKLPALHARFRDHTMRLFEKHGMENIIYWTVAKGDKIDGDDAENMLVYIIAHENEAAREASWQAFRADPDWQAAAKKSEIDGKILAKPPRAILMTETNFSAPDQSVDESSTSEPRLWELRQYNDGAERVPHTVERFAWGETELFTKHGMETVKFWTATDDSAFIYLLAHQDQAAADASWKGFFGDFREFLQKYREAHPNLPEGRGNGMEVRFLVPTDYSPRK